MSELKPCPFCGEMPKVNTWTMLGITESRCFCDNEKCPVYLSKTVAIDDWNTRPIEDALNARVAELEGKIDQLTAHYNDAVSAGKVSVDVKRELTDAEIEELGAQEAERKEFCPNCEAVTPCTHEAELFVCDICGEDFAKYIVSRNCNVSDVSMTQDVLTDIKTPSSIENTNPDYYKQELARIAEFSQAVGLITTLKPTMVMDAEHPLDMAKEAAEYVTVRIAELEAENERLSQLLHDEMSQLEIATDLGNKRWTALNKIYEDGEKHNANWCKRMAQEGLGIKNA